LRLPPGIHPYLRTLVFSCLLAHVVLSFTQAQEVPQKPTEEPTAKASAPTEPQNPYEIELLETRYRFEANGDSRKEVHTRVHLNNELGVRQFARLNFDYNRSFQSIEIPLVHITHPSGGTADILPSAITDNPNPAVINAPAYQDVRVKSVRILGLEPGDNLEYRITTTTTHHPLAPDFWLDHTFDRSGIVSQEIFELDLPALPQVQMRINPNTPANSQEKSGGGDSARNTYRWLRGIANTPTGVQAETNVSVDAAPDIAITTFASWRQLSARLMQRVNTLFTTAFWAESLERIGAAREPVPTRQLYDFVSRKIATVDLPLDFALPFRGAELIFSSGYGRPEEKAELLLILDEQNSPKFAPFCLYSSSKSPETQLPRPSLFSGMLLALQEAAKTVYLDPSLEVAPFGMIRPDVRGKKALILGTCPTDDASCWTTITRDLPFPSKQRVSIDASIGSDGKLTAKVHYALRGDNELLLRIGFHQTPKDKWKDLAQLLSLSDGFRGQVTSVTASDPYATREPFTVDYEIVMPKFVDWSKKPVRIPALLPQLGLPDPPAKPAPGAATSPIELGTPLEVETHMTLHLPGGTTAGAPTGTSVQRDYATFASQYSATGQTVTASRHINFLLRQIPADRATDYNAFLHAVQNDQTQDFTLVREPPPAPVTKFTTPPPTIKP
jgi:hypothetical protein